MIALLYIPFVIFFGWLNAYWTAKWVDWKKGKKIKHFFNGLIHFSVAVGVYFLDGWKSAVALLFLTKVFFDVSYAYFHTPRLPLGYVTITPKSIVDKIEQWIFHKDGIAPKIFYLAFATILILWSSQTGQ